jgi:hypothetical protein
MMKFFSISLILNILFITCYGQTDTIPTSRDTIHAPDEDTIILQATSAPVQTTEPIRIRLDDGEEVYRLKPAVDIPITVLAGGWSVYAFSKIYNKDPSTKDQIDALNKDDINGFDRWGADVYSDKAANTSDIFFYGAMPLPVVLLFDKQIRKDAGKYAFLYLEAMSC